MRSLFLTQIVLTCICVAPLAVIAQDTSDEYVEAVKAAFKANYSKIETAQATYRTWDQQGPNSEKENLYDISYFVRGDELRIDREQTGGERQEIFLFKNNTWTWYNKQARQYGQRGRNRQGEAKTGVAWVKNPDQMAHYLPLDVRHEMSSTQNDDFTSQFERMVVTEVDQTDGQMIRVTGRVSETSETRITYLCDSERSFLPVRMYTSRPDDGSIAQRIDISYAPVLDGTAWWPERTQRCFFDEGVTTDPDSSDWRQSIIRELTSEVTINEPLDDSVFDLNSFIPDDTEIRDQTEGEI